MIRAALFDFDGTLADSFAAITASTNHVRGRFGLPALSESEVRSHVGHGLSHLMHVLAPGVPVEEAVSLYRSHHETVMYELTRPMPGVERTIPELARRSYHLGVCSNKRVEFTRRLVDSMGFGPHIGCVLGPEDVGGVPKPDPTMLLEGVRRLGVSPDETVYIGDMDVDVQTGKAAGVPVWLVPGGAVGEQAALEARPDRVLHGFSELLELLPGV
jgi:phosphoglycolate phosphatase-like HAD superfamily hydrolase